MTTIIKHLIIFGVSTCTAVLITSCGLLEPESETASLRIGLAEQQTAKSVHNADETLDRLRCVIQHGTAEVYSKTVEADAGRFHCEAGGLEPGSGYSVTLYGLIDEEVVARAYQGNITLAKGKTRDVELSWAEFKSTMTDYDGNVYQTVKIGNQWWMAENLKVTHYRNGNAIPNVTDNTDWRDLTTGAYCNYGNNTGYLSIYGRLYNWYAVKDSRKIAPAGWHVPTDEEWKTLEMFLGMSQSEADDTGWRGTNEGSKLAGRADLWRDGSLENNAAFGESGFSALPGGYRYDYDGNFDNLGYSAYFWSATEDSTDHAWLRHLYYYDSVVSRYNDDRHYGFSVRLVRD